MIIAVQFVFDDLGMVIEELNIFLDNYLRFKLKFYPIHNIVVAFQS